MDQTDDMIALYWLMIIPAALIPVVIYFLCVRPGAMFGEMFEIMKIHDGSSKLPGDAVPLIAQEEAAWVESLQGDWDIEAVDLEAIAQTNNRYVTPIGFKTAKVTGKMYIMGGGPGGMTSKQTFDFKKSPSTNQVYLDHRGSVVMTPGWPYTRPMRGQEGEVCDFKTVFASIRWTRRTSSAAATGFGQVQQVSAE